MQLLILFNGRTFWPEGSYQLFTRCHLEDHLVNSWQRPLVWNALPLKNINRCVYCSSGDILRSVSTQLWAFTASCIHASAWSIECTCICDVSWRIKRSSAQCSVGQPSDEIQKTIQQVLCTWTTQRVIMHAQNRAWKSIRDLTQNIPIASLISVMHIRTYVHVWSIKNPSMILCATQSNSSYIRTYVRTYVRKCETQAN